MNTRSIQINGEALQRARADKFMLQTELAAAAGTTATTVYRLENGKQNVSLKMLQRITSALGISPDVLTVQ